MTAGPSRQRGLQPAMLVSSTDFSHNESSIRMVQYGDDARGPRLICQCGGSQTASVVDPVKALCATYAVDEIDVVGAERDSCLRYCFSMA